MGYLDRYSLREMLGPALATGVVASFLLLTTQMLRVGEAAFGYGLTLLDFAALLALLLPRFLVFTVPLAVLVGVITGLGRMAQDRELTAIVAAGAPGTVIWRAPLAIGLAGALLTGVLTTWGEPVALARMGRLLVSVVEQNLAAGLTPGLVHDEIPGLVVFARDRNDAGDLEDVLVHVQQLDVGSTVVSPRAKIAPSGDKTLAMMIEAGEMVHLPDTGATDEETTLLHTRFATGQIHVGVGDTFRRRVKFLGDIDVLPQWTLADAARAETHPKRKRVMWGAWHQRFAASTTCLIFALFGMALALWRAGQRSSHPGANVFFGALLIAAWHLTTQLGDGLVRAGDVAPWLGAWAPPIGLAALGLFLLRRVVR